MKSFVIENIKLPNGQRIIKRYTVAESFIASVGKFIFFLTIVWPFQFLVMYPVIIICWLLLILLELIIRAIFWLIKLPFCLLFLKRYPNF